MLKFKRFMLEETQLDEDKMEDMVAQVEKLGNIKFVDHLTRTRGNTVTYQGSAGKGGQEYWDSIASKFQAAGFKMSNGPKSKKNRVKVFTAPGVVVTMTKQSTGMGGAEKPFTSVFMDIKTSNAAMKEFVELDEAIGDDTPLTRETSDGKHQMMHKDKSAIRAISKGMSDHEKKHFAGAYRDDTDIVHKATGKTMTSLHGKTVGQARKEIQAHIAKHHPEPEKKAPARDGDVERVSSTRSIYTVKDEAGVERIKDKYKRATDGKYTVKAMKRKEGFKVYVDKKVPGAVREAVELDEADTYAIYKKGKVFDTFRSKEDAHDSLDSMGLSLTSKKDYSVRKLPANYKNDWSMKEEFDLDEAIRVKDTSVSNTLGSLKKAKPGANFAAKDHAEISRRIAAHDVKSIRKKTAGNSDMRKAALKRAGYAISKEEFDLDEAQWGVENTYMKYSPDELKVKKMKMMKSISNLKGQHSSLTALGGKNPRAEEIRELEGKIRMINQALQSKTKKESFELEEDRNEALKALEGLAKRGGMDKADFQKAHDLYKANKLNDLRKHIYRLDTDPSEAIADIINRHDSKAFNSMYPKAKSGDYIRSIVLDHGGK